MPAPRGKACPECGARAALASDQPLVACIACGWRAAPRRMALTCACGCSDLVTFGPYGGDAEADLGLVWVLACSDCGEQLRIYQTSNVWRERKGRIDGPIRNWPDGKGRLWRVTMGETSELVGCVVAGCHAEALGKAIRLCSEAGLSPAKLDVVEIEAN